MNTRQVKKSDNSVAGGDEGGVAAAVNIPDLEDLVTKAVEAAVRVLRNELSKSLQDMKDYVADLEARIKTLESRQEGTDNKQSDQPENNDIRKTLEAVREENLRTRVIANDSEQYGRRQNLRFRGLRVKKDEDCRKTLTTFINTRLGMSIPEDAIEVAHPLPTRKPTNSAQQGIPAQIPEPVVIARFRDRNIRDLVIRERRKLKGTAFTIVEDLTGLNVEVMNRLKKSDQVEKSWSWNGHIYAILKNKRTIKVRPFQAISDCEIIN